MKSRTQQQLHIGQTFGLRRIDAMCSDVAGTWSYILGTEPNKEAGR